MPTSTKRMCVKWTYKTKCNDKGEIEKHKVRIVEKGYSQQYRIT